MYAQRFKTLHDKSSVLRKKWKEARSIEQRQALLRKMRAVPKLPAKLVQLHESRQQTERLGKKQHATHPRREGEGLLREDGLAREAVFAHGRFVDYVSRGAAEFVHRFLTFPQTV